MTNRLFLIQSSGDMSHSARIVDEERTCFGHSTLRRDSGTHPATAISSRIRLRRSHAAPLQAGYSPSWLSARPRLASAVSSSSSLLRNPETLSQQ